MPVVLAEARFDPAQTYKARAVAWPMIMASRAEPDLMRVREMWQNEQALNEHFAALQMAIFLKDLYELGHRSVTVKCREFGPEQKMPTSGQDASFHFAVSLPRP